VQVAVSVNDPVPIQVEKVMHHGVDGSTQSLGIPMLIGLEISRFDKAYGFVSHGFSTGNFYSCAASSNMSINYISCIQKML
jgi:hypothetical protein